MYETLNELQQSFNNCDKCKLCRTRQNIVFGVGNPNADIMFIGEGPGGDEDRQGEPFVGKAGQLMNKAFDIVGIKREEVYIANIVKCRPPNNRDPEEDELFKKSSNHYKTKDNSVTRENSTSKYTGKRI